MHLSDADLRDLAAFLARRITTSFAAIDSAETALPGVPETDAWVAVLQEAQAEERLSDLVSRITAARPTDATLREACGLLVAPPAHHDSWKAGLMFVAATAAMGLLTVGGLGVAGTLVAVEAFRSTSQNPTFLEVVSVEPSTEGLPLVGDDRLGAVALDDSTTDPDGDHMVDEAVVLVVDGPPEQHPEPGVKSLVITEGTRVKCSGRPGEAVGYWYAGRHSPGSIGDTVVLDRSINVRKEHPSPDNGWFKNAKIRCVLKPGDHATLSAAPVELPGGHYWVPVLAGDITS